MSGPFDMRDDDLDTVVQWTRPPVPTVPQTFTLVEALDVLMDLWSLPWTEERYGEAQALLSHIRRLVVPGGRKQHESD